MHVRRLALQGVGRRAASGAPGHRAAVGGLLVARSLACRVGDRAVRVHRAVVRAGVLDRRFQPLLRHRHVEGESIERGADQTAFGLRVVEVLRQFAELASGRVRRFALELVADSRADLVVDRVLGRTGHVTGCPIGVRGALVLRRLEGFQCRKIHDRESLLFRVAADGLGVLVLELQLVQLVPDRLVGLRKIVPRTL